MTADEAWDKIVSRVKKNRDVLEEKVEEIWGDTIFSILLGYDDDDVLHQVPVQMGKETKRLDILVKEDRKNIFVVEFKRHYSAFDDHDKKQLFSYMRLLEPPVKVGILICKELYIYYDVPEKPLEMKIPFEHGNPQGSKFIDLFRKGNFDENAVKAFIEQQQTLQSEIQAIRADLQRVSINDIIKQYYKPQYSEEAIEIALKDLKVEVSFDVKKQVFPEHKFGAPMPVVHAGEKDTTQYTFKDHIYGKGRLVLAVISDYVQSHPTITRDELKHIFYKQLQGSLAVVEDIETANEDYRKKLEAWTQSGMKKNKPKFRFFPETLHLSDGAMYVSTEWGIGNIGKFIAVAKELGYDIMET